MLRDILYRNLYTSICSILTALYELSDLTETDLGTISVSRVISSEIRHIPIHRDHGSTKIVRERLYTVERISTEIFTNFDQRPGCYQATREIKRGKRLARRDSQIWRKKVWISKKHKNNTQSRKIIVLKSASAANGNYNLRSKTSKIQDSHAECSRSNEIHFESRLTSICQFKRSLSTRNELLKWYPKVRIRLPVEYISLVCFESRRKFFDARYEGRSSILAANGKTMTDVTVSDSRPGILMGTFRRGRRRLAGVDGRQRRRLVVHAYSWPRLIGPRHDRTLFRTLSSRRDSPVFD